MSARQSTWLAALVIVIGGAAAYANGFNREFVGLDAKESIRDNPHIQQLWPLTESMSFDLLDETLAIDEGSKGGTLVRRPFLSFSFALNYALNGLDARGFHAVNLLIHIVAALALFGIVRRTLRRFPGYGEKDRGPWIAAAVALLWVVHPLQTEAVTNIVQRAESMMGMCLLLTLYCSIRGFESAKPAGWYAAAVAACAWGMGTKETMVVAPLVVLLYDYTFASSSFVDALRKHATLHVGLAATWLILVGLIAFTAHDAAKDFQEGKTLPYVLAQPAVLLEYVRLSLWPHPLHMYVNTDVWAVFPGVTPASHVLLPGAIVVALVVATLWGLWRRRWWGFVGAWFFVILAPTSSFVATSDVIQEHRMYLSSAAILLGAVLAADALLRRLPRAAAMVTAALAVAAITLGFVSLTRARNLDYQTEFAMIHPEDMRKVHSILAQHELGRGRIDAALEQFRAAQLYIPNEKALAEAYYDLGNLLLRYEQRDLAKRQYELSVETNPNFGDAHNNLGAMLTLQGDLEGARRHFEEALRCSPRFPAANVNLGLIELRLGHLDAARKQFEAALQIIPGYEAAKKGLVLTERSRVDPKLTDFDLAFDIPTGYGDVAIRLKRARSEMDSAAAPCLPQP